MSDLATAGRYWAETLRGPPHNCNSQATALVALADALEEAESELKEAKQEQERLRTYLRQLTAKIAALTMKDISHKKGE